MSENLVAAEVVSDREPESDDRVLDYTLGVRRQIVEKHLQATNFAADPEAQKLVLQSLDGMDRVALGRKRINADVEQNQTNAKMQALVATVLMQTRDPKFMGGTQTPVAGAARAAPVLGNEVPDPVVVAGEMAQSPIAMTFAEFQAQFEPEAPNEIVTTNRE